MTAFLHQSLQSLRWLTLAGAAAALLACSSKPVVPDWSLNASDAAQRAMAAQLEGDLRVADQEWLKAHSEVAKTGQPAMVARLALMRCGIRVAALDVNPCTAYEAVAVDASAQDRAYARYLYGGLQPSDVALLPTAHQAVAQGIVACSVSPAQLNAVEDARAHVVAAGAAVRARCIAPEDAWPAVDTAATAQGWRMPLMAWMVLLQKRLQSAGGADALAQAELLERRLHILQGTTNTGGKSSK